MLLRWRISFLRSQLDRIRLTTLGSMLGVTLFGAEAISPGLFPLSAAAPFGASSSDRKTASAFPRLELVGRTSAGAVILRCTGTPGATYDLDVTSDLRIWIPLATLSSPDGISEYTDSSAASFTMSFYRAR